MSVVNVITGCRFAGRPELDEGFVFLARLQRGILASVFYFFVISIILATSGICLVKNQQNANLKIAFYGCVLFFACVIPIIVQSIGMFSLKNVSTDRMRELCDTDFSVHQGMSLAEKELVEDRRARVGPLVKNFIMMAQLFDKRSQNLLDQSMCTPTCPCLDSDGARNKYGELKDEFLFMHGR